LKLGYAYRRHISLINDVEGEDIFDTFCISCCFIFSFRFLSCQFFME